MKNRVLVFRKLKSFFLNALTWQAPLGARSSRKRRFL